MNDQTSEVEDLERILIDECAEPIKISYAAIRHITKNFAEVIGDGGFATVYLVCLVLNYSANCNFKQSLESGMI